MSRAIYGLGNDLTSPIVAVVALTDRDIDLLAVALGQMSHGHKDSKVLDATIKAARKLLESITRRGAK